MAYSTTVITAIGVNQTLALFQKFFHLHQETFKFFNSGENLKAQKTKQLSESELKTSLH